MTRSLSRSLPRPLGPALVLGLMATGCGTDVSGPSPTLLSCVFGSRAALAPGQALLVAGEASRDVCVSPEEAGGGEFLYVPFFAAGETGAGEAGVALGLDVQLRSGGVRRASESRSQGVGRPVFLTGGGDEAGMGAAAVPPERDVVFHDWLRRWEIEELTPRMRPAPPGAAPAPAPAFARAASGSRTVVPRVGDLRTFNVAISCSEEDLRTGRVVHVSERAIVVADTANPAEFTPQDLEFFAVTFDTLIYPVATAHFGEPGDIDDNGRSILFFTRAVNERNAHSATSVTIGFFWSGDLFPEVGTDRLQGCPAANQAEMVYLIAPDPAGVAGRAFEREDVRGRAISLIGHEYQHLVNASRRLFVNNADVLEEPWLNEGLSHVAEELLFFAASGLASLSNLGEDEIRGAPNGVRAFNEFMAGNLHNFRLYLEDPDVQSLMGDDLLATRGAAWAFLRYAAGRSARGDEGFFFDLVNSRVAGLANLTGVIGPDEPLDWMRDWSVSVFADDFVDGVEARFTDPTWNLRGVYEATTVGAYPLVVDPLDPESTLHLELLPGGAAYTRFDVAAGEQAVIHVDTGRDAPLGSLRGSVLRIR